MATSWARFYRSMNSGTDCKRRAFIWAATALGLVLFGGSGFAESFGNPQEGWSFRLQDFVIGAWCPPAANAAEYALYKEAGFNVVVTPRYQLPDRALDLAQEHGLMVMIDTYTPNGRPWGGIEGEYVPHPSHHPATLPELEWLHAQYGKHPALAGILLGDDIGVLPPPLVANTAWMRTNAPDLIPWICQCYFMPASLAEHGNPIYNPQFYPTLYNRDTPASEQAEEYCALLESMRESAQRYNLMAWPMFNVSAIDQDRPFESDSLVRFQIYAALAYGAQGIWYFTYNGYGGLYTGTSANDARANLDPKWYVAKEANQRVAVWGPELLGRTVAQVYHSGARPRPFRARTMERIDKTLFFNWEQEEPGPPITQDNFEVTWTGYIRAKNFDPITFYTISNDGVRLWVDGKKLIDNWTDHFAVEDSGTIQLPMAKMVPIRVEYYENDREAAFILEWEGPNLPREKVPSDFLLAAADARETGLKGEYRTVPGRLAALFDNSARPGRGKLVCRMSDDVLVGILTKPGRDTLAMVVDKRVDTRFGALDEREVKLRFADCVRSVTVLDPTGDRHIAGTKVVLTLPAGGGQLLRLETTPDQ